MKNLKGSLYILLFGVSGCSFLKINTHPTPLTQRYDTMLLAKEYDEDNSVITVATDVVPSVLLDTSRDNAKTIFDLQSNGQKALIEAYDKKDVDDGQKRLKALLNEKYQAKKTGSNAPVTKDYTIVFSTAMKDFYNQITKSLSEADRIAKLRFTVTIPDDYKDSVKFVKWDKFATQFAQFNIGGVSFNSVKGATLSPSIGLFGSAATSLGSIVGTNTYQENDSLQQRFVLLNGVLTSDKLVLDQTGTPQIDLQGNTTINVTVAFTDVATMYYFAFDGFQNEKGMYQTPDKISVKKSAAYYPQPKNDIKLKLSVDYVLRHVTKGDKTFTESDDAVSYYWGNFHPKIPKFINFKELKPKAWYLYNKKIPLLIRDPLTGQDFPLLFASFDEGSDFLDWLLYTVHNMTGTKITIGKYDLITTLPDNTQTTLNNKNIDSPEVIIAK
jgi:hypothetical protein